MGNGLLIRTAQIKTRQWSSFLLSFPSFSLHFPPSSACLPVCPVCVMPPPNCAVLSLSQTHKEVESVCMYKWVGESMRISLSFLPVPSLFPFSFSYFSFLYQQELLHLSSCLWRIKILFFNVCKPTGLFRNIMCGVFLTVRSTSIWRPLAGHFISISHSEVLCCTTIKMLPIKTAHIPKLAVMIGQRDGTHWICIE